MKKSDVYIVNYGRFSNGAAALKKSLKIKRVNDETPAMLAENVLINWGLRKLPPRFMSAGRVLNNPTNVTLASDKLKFFQAVQSTPPGGLYPLAPRVPDFTQDVEVAIDWLKQGEVLGRSVVNGKGGAGILFGSDEETYEDFLDCPLFVRYKRKKDEYRVHVFAAEVIDVQKKMLRVHDDNGTPIDRDNVDFRVRNVANGFIFARGGVEAPEDVTRQAKLAMGVTGLDFGAVDVIYNEAERQAYVLEINTAPGLMGTTLEKYTEAFTGILDLQ